ncbi:MAG: CapA family protein, partial [Myxococcaceae bacterium]
MGTAGAETIVADPVPTDCLPVSAPPLLAPASELAARVQLACAHIAVAGKIVDVTGNPIAGATVAIGKRSTQTGSDGAFQLTALPRANALMSVSKSGFHTSVRAVELYRPMAEAVVETGRLALETSASPSVLFSGDFSMGRRFLDPDESTPRGELPPDDPTALIRTSDPATGSLAAVQYVAPLFAPADFRVVNLETPVTKSLSTPHPTKDYAFFTMPESLVALQRLGVNFVSMGNNHVYDYQAIGLADTLANVTNAGIA